MITWCGKMSKQVIEPYDFQCKTNIEEHNDIVNKVNEIVDVVNELDVEEITKDISALESEVSAQGNEIDALNTEVAGLPTKTEVSNADVTAVAVDKTSEGIEIQLTRPAGVLEDSVALPFINTATLIPTSTERAFKIRFIYTDGTQYDTNEFVIPEGGGTDVSVTGVTVEDGTAPNSFKVAIQLSDASTIASNDYEIEIPAQQNTYPTSVSGTLSGSTLTLTIGLNNSTNVTGTADLSAFLTKSEASTTYLSKTDAQTNYQPKGNYLTSIPIAGDAIGGVKNGGNVTIENDGTMNVINNEDYSIYTGKVSNLIDSNYQSKYDILVEIRLSGFINCYKATVKNTTPYVTVETIDNLGYSPCHTVHCGFKGKRLTPSQTIPFILPYNGSGMIRFSDEKMSITYNSIRYSSPNTVLLYYSTDTILNDVTRRITEGALNTNEYRIWVK